MAKRVLYDILRARPIFKSGGDLLVTVCSGEITSNHVGFAIPNRTPGLPMAKSGQSRECGRESFHGDSAGVRLGRRGVRLLEFRLCPFI